MRLLEYSPSNYKIFISNTIREGLVGPPLLPYKERVIIMAAQKKPSKKLKTQHNRRAKYEEWLEERGLILLEGWARDGLTAEQIAHNMGISKKTLYEWRIKYMPIGDALKKGRDVADYCVENALFKSATGFYIDDNGTQRYIPPSQTAQIFWLKNRRPDKWKDKPIPDPVAEQKPDDGLIKALTDKVEEIFLNGDDSASLPEPEEAK